MNEQREDFDTDNAKDVEFSENATPNKETHVPDCEKPEAAAPVDRFIFTLQFDAVDGGAIIKRAGTLPGSSNVFTQRCVVAGELDSRRLQLGLMRKAKQLLVLHLEEAFKKI